MNNKHRYSEDWNDKIRPDILRRDLYKCTRCGIRHRAYVVKSDSGQYVEITVQQMVQFREQGKKAFRIFLQIAHLDNDPSNNDYSNLAALCPPCHLLNDAEWKKLLRKAAKNKVVSDLGAIALPNKKQQ